MAIQHFKDLSGAYSFVFKNEVMKALAGDKERITVFRKDGGDKNSAYRKVNGTPLEIEIADNEEVIEVSD
ncbi:MAG: hypothetical protein WCT50_02520 [Patescibacteria group bacterium]|jgi:hypothetical protein